MFEHFNIFIRSITAFVILLLITRLLGKQTLSNMNFHEFVTAVIMGAIGANFAFNENIQVTHLLISLVVFTGTSYLLAKLLIRNRKIRKWTEGTPTVLIEGGKILEENLKKNNLTLDSMNQLLRQKDIFNIEEVEHVLLELNGKVSVMKKDEHRNVTLKDLKLKADSYKPVPIELIMDGQMMIGNLENNQISRDWLQKELRNLGKTVQDVFYAVKGSDGKLYVDFFKDGIKHPVDIE
ncbi:DUF421 domain-containing protein [Paenibacillus paeoniae]|uniref:DUF421 domain-containing protein n=1 Tax=Paenibacillus paeoniae TaxID=2292705 RepID=A0A371PHY0_9BACL|nr:DUF421 domain-containing protein [Paenibacillus paeoniae]REK75832.1 DUF421 domain-containing protein [Paenibacillus paeoniae]